MYRRPAHVAYAVTGGEALLLDMDSGEHAGLSTHATRIWELVVEHGTAQAVVAALTAEFPDAGSEVIAADVAALLDRLVAAGLLDRVED